MSRKEYTELERLQSKADYGRLNNSEKNRLEKLLYIAEMDEKRN